MFPKLSIRQALHFPFSTKNNQIQLIILTFLSLVPFGESFFLSPYASALVSVVTREKNEQASLTTDVLLSRFMVAFLATLISFIYMIPGLVGLGLMIYFGIKEASVMAPKVLWVSYGLLFYGVLVLSVLPLATIHAVTTGKSLSVLALPRLLWIGLKIDFKTFIKTVLISVAVFFLKLGVSFLSLLGLGFLMTPFKAYAEYVNQYMFAKSYMLGCSLTVK